MKKNIYLLALLIFVNSFVNAQFGPPGGGGGFGGGNGADGNGRSKNNNGQPKAASFEIATPKGNSKIFGFVVDSTLTSAVEFANISLVNITTNKPIDGTIADEKGKFALTKIAAGEYKLLITFIGYNNLTMQDIKIEKGKDLDLGVIKLSMSSKVLEGVTVTGERSMIEEKVDRLVYNADKDLSSRGGDAADVLKKVPMLAVDLDGNVSIRGSSNIKVLINNKPSTIVASSIADALKMIPADLIQKVEVITSPSAKYDAEGTSGIINIITKKSSIEGFSLNIDSGVGLRASNLGLNGSYRTGKLGITLGGGGRAFYNKAYTTLDQTTKSILTQQSADAKDDGLFGRYNMGIDYEIDKKQSLSAALNFGTRNFNRNQNYTTNLFSNNVLSSTSFRDVASKDNSNSYNASLDYVRTFKPQQEWSISTLYSQNDLTNNFDANLLNSSRVLTGNQQNLNGNVNKELTFQTDYTSPISTNQLIEFGVKGIFRKVNSNYQYLFNGNSDAKNPAGLLNYNQNITSGYVSYTYSTKNKYTFKIGTRYEYTTIEANDQKSVINIPAYGNLVPSINISKSIGNSTIKLAYNNRISRPGLQQLNPNFNAANPQNITIGNPSLKPEVSNNVELSLSTNINKTYLNWSVFGRITNNSISRLSVPSDTLIGAIVTTYQNIGTQQTFGTNVFGNFFITPKWTINGGIDLFYNYLEGQVQDGKGAFVLANNTGVTFGGRFMTQIQLNHGWGIQGFGGYHGNQVQLQGMQGGMGMYSLGVKKDFNNKKGSFGLAVENIFGGTTMTTTLNSAQFSQIAVNNIYNQSIKMTLSLKMGNMKFVEQKKTKGVNNDDVKGGGETN